MFSLSQCRCNIVLLCGQHNIGAGSNSILGGPNVIYTAIAAICIACMNSNKVSRVKYWQGAAPPASYAYAQLYFVCILDLEI